MRGDERDHGRQVTATDACDMQCALGHSAHRQCRASPGLGPRETRAGQVPEAM